MNVWKSYIWTADKDVNIKAIFTIMITTWAVVKMGPEKIQACTGFKPMTVQAWIFSGLFFHNCSSSVHYCEIAFIFMSLSAVQIYDFQIVTVVYSPLPGFILNQHNDQLPVGLLAQLVEHCACITEVMGSNPVQAWIFFRPYFHYCPRGAITAKIVFIFTYFKYHWRGDN